MTLAANVSAAATAAASTAAIPFKPVSSFESGAVADGWLLAGLGLLVILAIAVLVRHRKTAWLPRSRSANRVIVIAESARLSDRMRLSVVRFRDRELLVAHGENNATVLADAPAPDPEPGRIEKPTA